MTIGWFTSEKKEDQKQEEDLGGVHARRTTSTTITTESTPLLALMDTTSHVLQSDFDHVPMFMETPIVYNTQQHQQQQRQHQQYDNIPQNDNAVGVGSSTTTDSTNCSSSSSTTAAATTTTTSSPSSSFLKEFLKSDGPPQIVFLIMLLALGFGSVIGVVPAVMTDRLARLNHGYTGIADCSSFTSSSMSTNSTKPIECLYGSADAQNYAATESFIANILTFLTSSYIGALSDEYGRRNFLILTLFLNCLRPLCLVLIQMDDAMNPISYYILGSISGLFNFMAISLSALSDVISSQYRAPVFGLLMAGFSLGFALAPQLALLLGHYYVSILSFVVVLFGFIMTVLFVPETVSPEAAAVARQRKQEQQQQILVQQQQEQDQQQSGRSKQSTFFRTVLYNIFYRPFVELSILNSSTLFRLLTALAFFSGVVTAGDQTLFLYYIEERLNFNDNDIAQLFLLYGCCGILVQGYLIQLFNESFGERIVVMIAFTLGAIHNVLYGIATNKQTILFGIVIASFVGMAFPTISAIKANNVDAAEQGRIQGALYSVSALASAVGPYLMRGVYHYTKDGAFMGPGSMFIVGAGAYIIAIYCSYLLPMEANSKRKQDVIHMRRDTTIPDVVDPETVSNEESTSTSRSDMQTPLL